MKKETKEEFKIVGERKYLEWSNNDCYVSVCLGKRMSISIKTKAENEVIELSEEETDCISERIQPPNCLQHEALVWVCNFLIKKGYKHVDDLLNFDLFYKGIIKKK